MTAHVHLGLVFHQHQPVGNYGFVFDELFAKSYEPLLACLERHPGVKAGLQPGTLYSEWNLSLPEREGGQPPAFEWREHSLTIETGRFRLTAAFAGCSGWHEHVFSASNTEGGVELQPQGWAIVFRAESARAAGHAMTIAWSIAPC